MADNAGFPDDFGPTLIDALYSQGGSVEVDEAFRDPPTLDGEVVDPATYQPGLPTPKVSAPPVPAGATKIVPAEGFGEVPLVEMLGYEIGFSAAWRAAAGWTGDQFVAYALRRADLRRADGIHRQRGGRRRPGLGRFGVVSARSREHR